MSTQIVEEDYYKLNKVLNVKANKKLVAFVEQSVNKSDNKYKSHLKILDTNICAEKCTPEFGSPCITFCPAGVYETIGDTLEPANPSNCLHCKTCQRKCPFDNIRWTAPEGGGGPRYKRM